MPENTDMKYYKGMVEGVVEGVGSAARAIGKRATGRASSDPTPRNPPAEFRAERRNLTSDADKKTFTDLEQGADIKRKAAEVRKKKDPKNQSLRPRARPKNATSLRPKVRPS
jgi:hypothetical protein